jgi:succinate dehydrogenase / fumarate reductase flavoprotein subunit
MDEMKETMFTKFGIFRDDPAMKEGLEQIRDLRDRFGRVSLADKELAANQALVRYLELDYMLQTAEVVALGALDRRESRGSHTRRDYPGRDDARFLKHIVARIKDGNVMIAYSPVTMGMFEPEERAY